MDVVIVGGGPGGLAAAYHLANLIRAHTEATPDLKLEGITIAVLEKGREIGSHGISGAVMDPRGISELMPDWIDRGAPIEAPVGDDAFWLMTGGLRCSAPLLPPPLQNQGHYVLALSKFVRWRGPRVAESGVDVLPECPAARALVEDGKVVGVRTADKGVDKAGQQKPNDDPGVD